jgi:glutamyl/glutaminyl-tRNA synthetase
MLPNKKEMEEFVKEIPKTAFGKLEAMNKTFLKDDNLDEAFSQMALFFKDLVGNNPEYFEVMKHCKTEEEIKQKSKEFFDNNPQMVDEVMLSMLAVKRDKWEKKEDAK